MLQALKSNSPDRTFRVVRNLREFRIKRGFCPDCGENLENHVVKWRHDHGYCGGIPRR